MITPITENLILQIAYFNALIFKVFLYAQQKVQTQLLKIIYKKLHKSFEFSMVMLHLHSL